MNAPSLQRLTLLSLSFHIVFFVAASLTVKQSSRFVMPSPYVVNLVGPDINQRAAVKPDASVTSMQEAKASKDVVSKEAKPADSKKDKYISERIAALDAKKKIERVVRVRNVISLKGSKAENKPAAAPKEMTGQGKNLTSDDYIARIGEEIRQHWVFPDTGNKNIEAIVSVKILKNGFIQVIGIEKKSGNHLLDRSALKAIEKASPVTPPPHEMEVGLRFNP
jgi:TolA protein